MEQIPRGDYDSPAPCWIPHEWDGKPARPIIKCNCGKKCQVPFRPDGAKPVYCKDCFGAPRAEMRKKTFSTRARPTGSIRPAGAQAPEGKSIADLTRQIAAMNTKIDTMLKILETK